MGIINITPDSFSDGQEDLSTKTVVKKVQKMVQDGANIIDIGGESTRPGFEKVPVEDELSRVIPVIEAIRSISDMRLYLFYFGLSLLDPNW